MTDAAVFQSNGSLPSPAQLALAMAIVKQKPADMDIKVYILQIRSFITNARDSNPVTDDKFFDSVSFWQQAYKKSEAEQSKLLDRIYELEQRNAALLAKSHTGAVKEEEILPESSKRKANPKNAVGTAIARKRAKTQALGQGGNGSQTGTGIQGEYGHILDLVDYVEEATGPFMRHFYTLQIALQKRPNRSNIVQATINMSISAADSLLNSVGEKKVAAGRSKAPITLQKKDPEIASVIRSIEYAIELIYLALGKISGSEQSASDVGQVTYHIVRLYDTAMKALEQYCKVKSEQMLAFAKTNSKPSKQKQSAKSKRTEQKPDQEIASQITRLLGTMTLSLDIIYKEHQDLLEGALFILLNRVGRLLCLFVFQDLQLQPDLRADPLKLPLPEGLKHFQLNEKSLCAAKLEARHLIWLLERVLTYFENNPPSQQSQAFTSKVKESLQSTLLQAVYGADDESFKKALRAPVPPDTLELEKLRVCAQVPEQQVPEWFVQETWRLLGWDMLVAVN